MYKFRELPSNSPTFPLYLVYLHARLTYQTYHKQKDSTETVFKLCPLFLSPGFDTLTPVWGTFTPQLAVPSRGWWVWRRSTHACHSITSQLIRGTSLTMTPLPYLSETHPLAEWIPTTVLFGAFCSGVGLLLGVSIPRERNQFVSPLQRGSCCPVIAQDKSFAYDQSSPIWRIISGYLAQ